MKELFDKAINYVNSSDLNSFSQLLSTNPELAKYKDEFGSNLLMEVISNIDIPVVKKLIDMQSDINLLDQEGMTSMHILIENKSNNYLEKIKLLLDSGFNLEIAGYNGWKPLHKAVFHNYYDIVELFLEKGADINSRTDLDNEKTALMIAASNNNFRMVKILVEKGANISLKDKYARTAKDYAWFLLGWRIKLYLKSIIRKSGTDHD